VIRSGDRLDTAIACCAGVVAREGLGQESGTAVSGPSEQLVVLDDAHRIRHVERKVQQIVAVKDAFDRDGDVTGHLFDLPLRCT
jgi:hypothetical protein